MLNLPAIKSALAKAPDFCSGPLSILISVVTGGRTSLQDLSPLLGLGPGVAANATAWLPAYAPLGLYHSGRWTETLPSTFLLLP